MNLIKAKFNFGINGEKIKIKIIGVFEYYLNCSSVTSLALGVCRDMPQNILGRYFKITGTDESKISAWFYENLHVNKFKNVIFLIYYNESIKLSEVNNFIVMY